MTLIAIEDRQDYLHALALSQEEGGSAAKAYELLKAAASQGDQRAKYAIATWLLHGKQGVVEADVKTGLRLLRELAKSNIAEALFDLAVSYDYGWGTRRNEQAAFSCYMRSALLGSKKSCAQIAEFYREGALVKHDHSLYLAWKKRSRQPEVEISPPYRLWLETTTPQN
jgi:hypothetical protein